jgi:methanol---5-hydroxybenzimidazolylcobamide Co-methyltransferase
MFGHAQKPVTTRRGLVIGGGTVYPELNFTLPSMEVTMETLNDVKTHYTDTVRGAPEKAHHRGLTC